MKLKLSNGLEIEEGTTRILLDPRVTEPGVPAFITHAHADHVPRDVRMPKGPIICTEATADILAARYGFNASTVTKVRFREPFEVGPLRVTPFPAGHVLGSAMFLIEGRGTAVLYTGDVNPIGGLTVESPAEVPEADVLIIESTYGSPKFRFPHPQTVRARIALWAAEALKEGRVPAILAYAVGKAQEITAALNRLLDVPVFVDKEILKVAEAYKKHLRTPLEYQPIDDGSKGVVVISSRKYARTHKISVVTGWALLKKPKWAEAGFPLSSHADFEGLLEVAHRSGASLVFTVMGRTLELARILQSSLGVEARPLGEKWEEL